LLIGEKVEFLEMGDVSVPLRLSFVIVYREAYRLYRDYLTYTE